MEKTVSPTAVVKWAFALVAAQWLAIPSVMRVLMVLMACDYATGLAAAWMQRKLSSAAAYRGLVKKALVIVLLLVARYAERAAGIDLHVDQFGAIGYIVGEVISIVENVARAGVPIPAQIVEALLAAKKLSKPATPEQLKALEDGVEPGGVKA